jgi:hypothetical protein
MYQPKQVVRLDKDPLADRDSRTSVIIADSEYDDWLNNGRYNIVCLTSDFNEYEDHEHTRKLHKDKHTAVGELSNHSLICPWATLAIPGRSLRSVTTDDTSRQNVELTDSGHELVARTLYQFYNSHNDYSKE